MLVKYNYIFLFFLFIIIIIFKQLDLELDKLEQKVDLLDSIVTELEYNFSKLFSEDPDNVRLKDIKAKFNLCIRNIDLYGDVKGKSLVVYDDGNGDYLVNNTDIYNDLKNYDLNEKSENDDSTGLENKNFGCWNDDNIDDDYCDDDDGFSFYEKGQCSHAAVDDLGNDDDDARNDFYENYETGQCSHLTKESDNEIVKDICCDKENKEKKVLQYLKYLKLKLLLRLKKELVVFSF